MRGKTCGLVSADVPVDMERDETDNVPAKVCPTTVKLRGAHSVFCFCSHRNA